MKRFLLYPCLMSLLSANPLMALAGGLETPIPLELSAIPAVDIPEQKKGFSIGIESALLRPYNNNLGYGFTVHPFLGATTPSGINYFDEIVTVDELGPQYDFNLRLNVDVVLGYSGNKFRLTYDHLFDRNIQDHVTNWEEGSVVGEVRQKLDMATLISQQHMLIGQYWEASFSGGVGFAHLNQHMRSYSNTLFAETPFQRLTTLTKSVQYNGVGPLLGLGSTFHATPSISLGAETESILLIGNNNLDMIEDYTNNNLNSSGEIVSYFTGHTSTDGKGIYNIVPQWNYRVYVNYLYRTGSENALLVELGWRGTQFFNVRSYEAPTLFRGTETSFTIFNGISSVQSTTSDKISFAGPYLLLRWDM